MTDDSLDNPFLLNLEFGGFALMYGACRAGIVVLADQKEHKEGRALHLGWPVLIGISRARETYYGLSEVPFGQVKTGVITEVAKAIAELPLHERDGADLEPDLPVAIGEGRLDREVAGILASWELEDRHGEPVALRKAEIREIGAPYVEDAIRRMRRGAEVS